MNGTPSRRGKQMLPTEMFTTQQISFLVVLRREVTDARDAKERSVAQNRYLSCFTNCLRAATTPKAVRQLMALPAPSERLERQLRNKLRQLTVHNNLEESPREIQMGGGSPPLPQFA